MDRVKNSEAVADASITEDGYVRCSECGRLGQHEDDCKKLTQGKAAEKMNPVTIPELRSLLSALPALLDVAEAALKARSQDETFTGCISDPRCNVCSRCRVEVALAKLNGAMGTDVHGDEDDC